MAEKHPEEFEQTDDDLLGAELRKKLETEHEEVIAIEVRGGKNTSVFAFRRPTRAEVKRYRTKTAPRDKRRGGAVEVDATDEAENLLTACCVHPSPDALDAFFDKYALAVSSTWVTFSSAWGFDYEAASAVK